MKIEIVESKRNVEPDIRRKRQDLPDLFKRPGERDYSCIQLSQHVPSLPGQVDKGGAGRVNLEKCVRDYIC